jgi:hypothetical protein
MVERLAMSNSKLKIDNQNHKYPEPIAIGNDKIKILKHEFEGINDRQLGCTKVLNVAIRNISELTIATIIFEAQFYDIEGNILEAVKHKEIDLRPKTSRAVFIQSSIMQPGSIKGYNIKVTKTITTDLERVQLRRHEIRTTETGDEEVGGIIKNISEVKTNAALVATFKDSQGEKIGVKVLQIKDMYLGELRKFHFIFTPPEGVKVKTYSLDIGEMIEQPDIE